MTGNQAAVVKLGTPAGAAALLPGAALAPNAAGQPPSFPAPPAAVRGAAVAHDVARLIYIQEKRPDAVWNDEGTHFPLGGCRPLGRRQRGAAFRQSGGADGDSSMEAVRSLTLSPCLLPADAYKFDATFLGLLENGTSFADVCSLLRSGALADQFLCTQVGHHNHKDMLPLFPRFCALTAECSCCCTCCKAAGALNRAIPPACTPGAYHSQGIQQHIWRSLHAQSAALHAAADAAGGAAIRSAAGGAAEERGAARAAQTTAAAGRGPTTAQAAGGQGAVATCCCCLAGEA